MNSQQFPQKKNSKLEAQLRWLKTKEHQSSAPRIDPKATDLPETSNIPSRKLPYLEKGTLPNHLNRSSLIAPIGQGLRATYKRQKLVSRTDCDIYYTGEQLDEADGDVLMTLIYLARGEPLGQAIHFNRAQTLRMLHRQTGDSQYKWLLRRIMAMTEATMYIKTSGYLVGKIKAFHIISKFDYDEQSGNYSYVLDPDWLKLFSNKEFYRLDWNKRMQIRRQLNIAKALQRLIATDSSKIQRYRIDELKKKFVYNGRLNDFLASLNKNIDELKRLAIVQSWKIEDSSKGHLQLILNLH